jgi:hypothetical protein
MRKVNPDATGRLALCLALWVAAGCDHSDPFVTASPDRVGPFATSVPLRLTYSPGWDMQPAEAAGGGALVYVYDRRTPDRDRCIGILPGSGGSRVASLCAWEFNEGGTADQLARPALRADGRLLFTRHFGRIISLTADSAAVYLTHVDSLPCARKVLALQRFPPGGDAAWDDLLDPVWLDTDQLLVVGARRQVLVPSCCANCTCPRDPERFAGPDTVTVGVHLARLRLDQPTPQITLLGDATDAIAMAHDASTGDAVLAIQRALPDDPWHEPNADTIVRIPATGGARTVVYGWPRPDGFYREHLHGVAAGGGRIFASRSYRRGSLASPVESDLFEVMADGTLRSIAKAPVWRWGAIRLSADGRSLLAEGIDRTTSHIYRVEVGP